MLKLVSLVATAALLAPVVQSRPVKNGGDFSLKFEPLPAANGNERFHVRSSHSVKVNGDDKKITYHAWARSGDKFESGPLRFGHYYDKDGKGMTGDGDPPALPTVSNYPDFNSLLTFGSTTMATLPGKHEKEEVHKVYSVTHFESGYPSSAYFTKHLQDPKTGNLFPVKTTPVDFSEYNGMINPCAGSVSPWMSHLGSEENDIDASKYLKADAESWKDDGTVAAIMAYLDKPEYTAADAAALFKPYMYGWIWEVTVNPDDETAAAVKHFAMGRSNFEMAKVMPDEKTVYLSSDGGSGRPSLLFIADHARDLSAGTLYAMKAHQKSPVSGPASEMSFDVSWIRMGHASDSEISALINGGIQFTDIFTKTDADCTDSACTCASGKLGSGRGSSPECLELKPGMETAAAFLEATRYAGYVGGTTEWTKWEGVTHDAGRNKNYFALSSIGESMLDIANDGSSNDIKVASNPCGCVMEMSLDSSFVAHEVKALVCGSINKHFVPTDYITKTAFTYVGAGGRNYSAFSYDLDSDKTPEWKSEVDLNLDANNVCDLGGLASPDNLAYASGYNGLFIGEDTDLHQNDMVWYYDFSKKRDPLTRIMTMPFGSEATAVYWYPSINGWDYIQTVVQHPYSEDSTQKLSAPPAGPNAFEGYVGYIKLKSQFHCPN